jgi:predicted MPP superfamily phosphohydrolase
LESRPIRKLLAGLIFLGLFITVIGGSHYYLARRLVIAPAWSRDVALAIYLAAGLGISALVIQALIRRRFGIVSSALSWGGYSWMGLVFYILIVAFALELPWLLIHEFLPDLAETDPVSMARARALMIITSALILSTLALRSGLRAPTLKKIGIEIANWPPALEGFRIVQVSDVHIGPLLDRRFSRSITDRVNALEPDMVAVTGDLVDGSTKSLRVEVEPFREMRGIHGVYFVTGNHDFYSGADDWVSLLRDYGWRSLRNERVSIEVEGSSFDLAGVDDRSGAMLQGEGGEDLDLALEGWTGERPLILLAHDPGTFHRAQHRKVDLQISGHTHGGQIWPFSWMVRAAVPWVKGHHRTADSQIYVSSGTGFWGPPMRLGTSAEITELTITTPVSVESSSSSSDS